MSALEAALFDSGHPVLMAPPTMPKTFGENVTIRNTVTMGADIYERDAELKADRAAGRPPIGIGNGSRIEGAILDKNCRIGQGVQIVNERKVETRGEDEACIIRDGIPIVVKEGVLPDGWKL